MSGADDWDANERALYALGSRLLLDDIDRYREELSAGVSVDTSISDAMIAEAAARTKAAQEETRRYLAQLAGADEPAPAQDVQQGQATVDASAAGSTAPARPGGPGPAGQPNDAAELAEAQRLAGLTLSEFAAERERLIRANASHGLFG